MTNMEDINAQLEDALKFRAKAWEQVCHALANPLSENGQRELTALHEGAVREVDALRTVQLQLATHGRVEK